MSPELEVLDQLIGGDLSLDVIAGLFPEEDHCRRAVQAMLHSGYVLVLDEKGLSIPEWRYLELRDQSEIWKRGTPYRMSITDAGAKRVG